MSIYFLYECSLGYALFEIKEYEEISQNSKEFQQSIMDYKKVSQIIKKVNFLPFKTSEEALENAKDVNDNIISETLKSFLKTNFPSKKGSKLGTVDKDFAVKISSTLKIDIIVGDFLVEVSRAIRQHIDKFLQINDNDITKSELGLGHSYSRMKCMFDVNRQDKPIVQSIALIDLLDKDINSFCMRIKEWFGWHFPELGKIISDNYVYVRIVKLIKERKNLLTNKDSIKNDLDEITLDPEISKAIIDSATISMGADIGESDLLNIRYFSDKVEQLIKYRENLTNYLKEKMRKLAPNTSELIGEMVAARLISHAGSLTALAKYPASTIQILGAEKALFRALKTRSKTPKYGLLYHSSYIGKAKLKNKGKISRYLANKIAMCARIDYFSNDRFNDFGVELKKQIEERLNFLDNGEKPRKNIDVMKKVIDKITEEKKEMDNEEKQLGKKKKRKERGSEESDSEEQKVIKKKKKVESEESDSEDMKVTKKKKKVENEESDSEDVKIIKKKKKVESEESDSEDTDKKTKKKKKDKKTKKSLTKKKKVESSNEEEDE